MSLMSNCRWTDIRSLMNNFVKHFVGLKIDPMQYEVHGTAQSSFTCKDKWSHRGEYNAEIKRAVQFTSNFAIFDELFENHVLRSRILRTYVSLTKKGGSVHRLFTPASVTVFLYVTHLKYLRGILIVVRVKL